MSTPAAARIQSAADALAHALERAVELAQARSGAIVVRGDRELEVVARSANGDGEPADLAEEELNEAVLAGARVVSEAAVIQPLRPSGERVGVLVLGFDAEHTPGREDEVLHAALAELCAQALETARLADVAEPAERRSRFLVEAAETLATSLDYRLTLRRLARLVVPRLADWCSVDVVEADGSIQSVALAHADPERVQGALELRRRYPPGPDSAVANVVATGETMVYEDLRDDVVAAAARDEEHLELLRAAGLRSAVVVPLTARRRTFGAITLVWAESGRTFAREDVELAEELGRRAAIAVDNARLFGAERRARKDLERLQALTAALAETMTTADVASVIVDQATATFGAEAGIVLLLTPDRKELEIVASSGAASAALDAYRRFGLDRDVPAARAVRERKAVWLGSLDETLAEFPEMAHVPDRVGHSYAAVPLCAAQHLLGAVVLGFARPHVFGAAERSLVLTLADQCAQAFERARLYERERAAREAAERAGERVQKIQEVLEIGLTHLSLDDLLQELLGRLRALIGTDAATILLLDEKGAELRVRATVGIGNEEFRDQVVPIGVGITGQLAATGKPIVVDEVPANPEALPFLKRSVRSLIGVPLLTREGVTGVLHLTTIEPRRFTDDEVALLEAVAARAALAIERTRFYEREHEIAETLQRSMLPQELPEVPGLELVARYTPGSLGMTVGGDWYDALELPDGRIGVAVGDIVGKGLKAATEMVRLRNAFRAYALEGLEPADVVERLNGLVERQGDGQYSTLVYAVFDPRRSRLAFASAGHPPPLVRGPFGSVTYLEGGRSLPLGVAPELECEQGQTQLPANSTLLLYTDGLVERREVGITEGLLHLAERVQKGPVDLEQLVDGLIEEIVAGGLDDDIGVVALRPVTVPSHLALGVPAQPEALRHVRRELREWLTTIGVPADAIEAITSACNEAVTNAIEHPLAPTADIVQLEADVVEGQLAISIRDSGRWRSPQPQTERGLGLRMVQDLMDTVEVNRSPEGTEVRMVRRFG